MNTILINILMVLLLTCLITSVYDKTFLMVGDFNSRTGTVDDNLEDIEVYVYNITGYNLYNNIIGTNPLLHLYVMIL